jgi:hypothetical protein
MVKLVESGNHAFNEEVTMKDRMYKDGKRDFNKTLFALER